MLVGPSSASYHSQVCERSIRSMGERGSLGQANCCVPPACSINLALFSSAEKRIFRPAKERSVSLAILYGRSLFHRFSAFLTLSERLTSKWGWISFCSYVGDQGTPDLDIPLMLNESMQVSLLLYYSSNPGLPNQFSFLSPFSFRSLLCHFQKLKLCLSGRNGEEQGETAPHHPVQTKKPPLTFNER